MLHDMTKTSCEYSTLYNGGVVHYSKEKPILNFDELLPAFDSAVVAGPLLFNICNEGHTNTMRKIRAR